MIHYLLKNPDGSVFQRGSCAREDIPSMPNTTLEIIEHDDERTPHQANEPSYAEYRAMAYPTIGDQLGALWKLIESAGLGEMNSEVRTMLDKIQEVKDTHPKEAS